MLARPRCGGDSSCRRANSSMWPLQNFGAAGASRSGEAQLPIFACEASKRLLRRESAFCLARPLKGSLALVGVDGRGKGLLGLGLVWQGYVEVLVANIEPQPASFGEIKNGGSTPNSTDSIT